MDQVSGTPLTTSAPGARLRRTNPGTRRLPVTPRGADPVQLGTQFLGPEMLAFLDLERGQRVYPWLAGLLAGLGE